MDHKLLRQYCRRWLNKIHFNNNKSFKEVVLKTLEFFNSPKDITGCQIQWLKELKILRWDHQADMNKISECHNSQCVKVTIINSLFINNNLYTSTQALPICPIQSSKLSCTTPVNSSSSSINNRCRYHSWIRLQVSWVLQLMGMFLRKLLPSRLNNFKTMWWTTTLWIVPRIIEEDQAPICLRILRENLTDEIFQIFSNCQTIKIHKIWRKDKSWWTDRAAEFHNQVLSIVPPEWVIWAAQEDAPATIRKISDTNPKQPKP